MDIRFFNRDYTNRQPIPKSAKITAASYKWSAIGGPERASLRAKVSKSKWALQDLLRCPVEIWDEERPLWWGFVNSIVIPVGDVQRMGISIDNMYNYIIVAYSEGDTSAGSDSVSISEYGQKEIRLTNVNADQTEAEQVRDLYLADHQTVPPKIDFSGGNQDIEIECYGWYSTLAWKYYANATETNTENTTQISDIIDSAGQFFNGAIIEDTASITSNEFRDGNSNALTLVNQLLAAGTSNTRPLLATVDRELYLHVFERTAPPPTTQPDYLIRGDGKLITPFNEVIPDKYCKVGVWVKHRDIPIALEGFNSMPPAFIESAEYDLDRNRTVYKFANDYEQIRLARFVADIVSGNNSGSGGYTYNPYSSGYVTPTQQYITRPTLVRSAAPTTDFTGVFYIDWDTALGTHGNFTYNGLSYMYPGTDGDGNDGIEILASGVYRFEVYVEVFEGSSAPTSGSWAVELRKKRLGVGGQTILPEISIPWDAALGVGNTTIVCTRRFDAGDFFLSRAHEYTDGEINVNYSEIVGEFLYPLASTA